MKAKIIKKSEYINYIFIFTKYILKYTNIKIGKFEEFINL